jgi:cell surface protein SprA
MLPYTIPINKIPLLDWTSCQCQVWRHLWLGCRAHHPGLIPSPGPINLGNSIKNSNTIQLNGQLNLVNLYNKIGYLKDINDKYRNAASRKAGSRRPGPRPRYIPGRTSFCGRDVKDLWCII